jgi:hypothetical protein
MKQTEVRQQLDYFIERISARLEKGQEEYGNRSFEQPLDVLSNEVLEELEDTAIWSFIIWVRVQSLRQRLLAEESLDKEV